MILIRPEKTSRADGEDMALQVRAVEQRIESVLELNNARREDLRKRKEELRAG